MKIPNNLSKNDFIKNYSRMWPFVKPFWFVALLSLVISVPVGFLDATVALFLKPYTDVVLVEKNTAAPWYIPMLIVGFTIIQGGLLFAGNVLNAYAGGKLTLAVKEKLYAKLLSMQPSFFDGTNSGMVLFRFSNDAETACAGLLYNLKNLVTRVCSSLGLIFVLFYNSWHLAIIAVLILAVAITPLAFVKRLIKSTVAKDTAMASAIITYYNETFAGNRTIAAYNLQNAQNDRFLKTANNIFQLMLRITRKTAWLSPVMHFIISIGLALAISVGSWLIVSGTISAGNFVSFLAALLMLYTPLKTMGNTIVGIQMSFLAIERIFENLEMEPTIVDAEHAKVLTHIEKGISLENLSFSYTKECKTLININLDVKVGETIALVGNSGGGKTTLVNLLPRFYDIDKGTIKIDGTDIRDFTISSLRSQMAVVFQDNFLFSGTIRENILCGKEGATEEEVLQAIKNACLEEFILSLPDGLDTEIGERGVLLSGGQKQRVAIARAFLKDAPIIILDEATSALDNKSEQIVQQAIDNLMKDRTVFVIAHRLSTVRNATKIAVIDAGKLVEIGNHMELMELENGFYKQLYEMQFYAQGQKTQSVDADDSDNVDVLPEQLK